MAIPAPLALVAIAGTDGSPDGLGADFIKLADGRVVVSKETYETDMFKARAMGVAVGALGLGAVAYLLYRADKASRR